MRGLHKRKRNTGWQTGGFITETVFSTARYYSTPGRFYQFWREVETRELLVFALTAVRGRNILIKVLKHI